MSPVKILISDNLFFGKRNNFTKCEQAPFKLLPLKQKCVAYFFRAPFKIEQLSDGTMYNLILNGKYSEFGDFLLKLIAEVSGHGAPEGYWMCTCGTYVHKHLQRRHELFISF